MALRMLRLVRRDGEHARGRPGDPAAVYRYVLAVLRDEADARAVTRATLERGRAQAEGQPPTRRWLFATAHELARTRGGDMEPERDAALDEDECAEVERLLSRALDGRLRRADRRRVRRHLARCGTCRARGVFHLALRRAVRSLAGVSVPSELLADGGRFTSPAPGGSLAQNERRPVGIVNRRNAMLGWAAWQVGKRVARRKARSAVPAIDPESKRPNKPALAAAAAALVGGLVFWKRQRESESPDQPE